MTPEKQSATTNNANNRERLITKTPCRKVILTRPIMRGGGASCECIAAESAPCPMHVAHQSVGNALSGVPRVSVDAGLQKERSETLADRHRGRSLQNHGPVAAE